MHSPGQDTILLERKGDTNQENSFALTGYLHPTYARSLSHFGRPQPLPRCGAWLLVRPIPHSDQVDALAGYRNLYCRDWSALAADVEDVEGIISVTAVTDPMTPLSPGDLRCIFPSLVRPYKENYLVDLRNPAPSRNNRRRAKKASAAVDIRIDDDPSILLNVWEELFDGLRARHTISGIAGFSKTAFRDQLATPGCVAVRASVGGSTVSMVICYVMGDVVHAHLAASDALGYRLAAAYAIHQVMIDEFAGRGFRWLVLGSTSGVEADSEDGLAVFKKGWANATRLSYLCGRIYDPIAYARLASEKGTPSGNYFPAYRGADGS